MELPVKRLVSEFNKTEHNLLKANKMILDKGLCLNGVESDGFEGAMEISHLHDNLLDQKIALIQDCIRNYNIINIVPPKAIIGKKPIEKVVLKKPNIENSKYDLIDKKIWN